MLLLAHLAAVAAIDLKPQYHFTRNANEMNDPNGLMMHVEFTSPHQATRGTYNPSATYRLHTPSFL